MRIWHYKLLEALPDLQFKGQLRELVVIMRDWRDKGKTNHILINAVTEYPKSHLSTYFDLYRREYKKRYHKDINSSIVKEFSDFSSSIFDYEQLLWHDNEYLLVCKYNLYEKYKFGRGKSRISQEDWNKVDLLINHIIDGY